MAVELGLAHEATREVGLDGRPLVGFQTVERVHRDLVEGMLLFRVAHGRTPSTSRARRRLASPERMRLFTVPSGTPNIWAVSR